MPTESLEQSLLAFCTAKYGTGIEPLTVNNCCSITVQPLLDVTVSLTW